jgi:predicted dehydrogenase
LSGTKHVRLRVGIVGLGRLWEARHKPALAKLKDRFQVVGLYDQVARRAQIEAASLGCQAVDGLVALIGRPDVDVVYVLTPQWFGLHAIELACQFGKPVYCAVPLDGEAEDLARLDGLIQSSRIPFMPEFARRFYPASLRLRELLATRLGAPRLVVAHGRLFGFDRYGQPGPSTQIAPTRMLLDPGSYLLDWCRFVFSSEPTAVQAWGGQVMPQPEGLDRDFETFLLEFPAGAVAQVSVGRYHRGPWGEASRFLPQPGIQVFAERGVAWLELPDRIQWNDAEGVHDERLPLEPAVGEILGDHFHRFARGLQSLAPNWDDARAVAQLIAAIRVSGAEGRRVPLDGDSRSQI